MSNSSTSTIVRTPLLKVELGSKHVTSVDVRRIEFAPGQQTARHRHPCPVVGLIVDGSAIVQIEGEAAIEIKAGSAFYEPANTVMSRFDNASFEAPMTFVCYYLLDGEQELIEMLEKVVKEGQTL